MGQAVSFELRMGHKHTQVTKLGKAHREKPEKKNHSKNHFFKDFDEFHNFGLEMQTKAEGKIITKMSSKYLCMILVYVTLTKYFALKFSIGRV